MFISSQWNSFSAWICVRMYRLKDKIKTNHDSFVKVSTISHSTWLNSLSNIAYCETWKAIRHLNTDN